MNKPTIDTIIYRPPFTIIIALIFNRCIALVLIMIISGINEFINHSFYTNNLQWEYLLFLIFLSIVIMFIIYSIFVSYLAINPSGLLYHGMGFSIYAKWNDILGINSTYDELILENPGIDASFWIRHYLEIGNQDHRIPMRLFDKDWRDHELGKYIIDQIMINNKKKGINIPEWRM